jgi:hypothetical protein
LQGLDAAVALLRVLLADQSTTTQNGVYVVANGATVQHTLGTTSGGGTYTQTGLVAGRLYRYEPPAGSFTAGNGTTTINGAGYIAASNAGEVIFTAAPATDLSSHDFFEASLVRAPEFDGAENFKPGVSIRVEGGAGAPEWFVLTSTVTTLGSSAIVFEEVTVGNATPNFAAAFDNTAATPRALA